MNSIPITLYICGPMTFRADTDFNYPAFNAAAKLLRQAGYTVMCPTEVDFEADPLIPPTKETAKPWDWYMRRTLIQVIHSTGIAILPCTMEHLFGSDGAQTELFLARKLKLPILTVDEWVSEALRHREIARKAPSRDNV